MRNHEGSHMIDFIQPIKGVQQGNDILCEKNGTETSTQTRKKATLTMHPGEKGQWPGQGRLARDRGERRIQIFFCCQLPPPAPAHTGLDILPSSLKASVKEARRGGGGKYFSNSFQ